MAQKKKMTRVRKKDILWAYKTTGLKPATGTFFSGDAEDVTTKTKSYHKCRPGSLACGLGAVAIAKTITSQVHPRQISNHAIEDYLGLSDTYQEYFMRAFDSTGNTMGARWSLFWNKYFRTKMKLKKNANRPIEDVQAEAYKEWRKKEVKFPFICKKVYTVKKPKIKPLKSLKRLT